LHATTQSADRAWLKPSSGGTGIPPPERRFSISEDIGVLLYTDFFAR
jgi:hypothetical protein